MLGCFLKHNKETYKAFKKHQKAKDEHAKDNENNVIGKKRKRSTDSGVEEPTK
jgi:hypothetical protein